MEQQKAEPKFEEGSDLEQNSASLEPEEPAAPASEPASSASESPSSSEQAQGPTIGERTNAFTNNVKQSTTQLVEKVNTFSQTSSGQIIAMTIIGILVVAAVALLLYYIIQKTLISQSSYSLVETKTPVLATQITNCEGSPIPNPSSGVRSGMCFWMYIYDISKYQGSVRHVFHRGQKTDGFNISNGTNTLPNGPYVALDQNTSALSIVFGPETGANSYFKYYLAGNRTLMKDSTLSANSSLAPTPYQMLQVASQSRGIVFPYIPLQRWVHVACVINENLNGGTITGYIDAELAVTATSSSKTIPVQVTTSRNGTTNVIPAFDMNNLNIGNTGDVYIGGSVTDPIGPGFSGLVSGIQFYNYDISAQDVYANYKKGPFNNPLAALGLPAYGVQSPIYKIS